MEINYSHCRSPCAETVLFGTLITKKKKILLTYFILIYLINFPVSRKRWITSNIMITPGLTYDLWIEYYFQISQDKACVIYSVAQKSLGTGGYIWTQECQVTSKPLCITSKHIHTVLESEHLQAGVKDVSLGVLYDCTFLFLVETTKTESTPNREK